MPATTFTLDERTAISRAFDAGNYANAYESDILAFHAVDEMPEHDRSAFILGFFSSYGLDEIGSDREAFDTAYFSDAGRAVLAAGYCDDRTAEYLTEAMRA